MLHYNFDSLKNYLDNSPNTVCKYFHVLCFVAGNRSPTTTFTVKEVGFNVESNQYFSNIFNISEILARIKVKGCFRAKDTMY